MPLIVRNDEQIKVGTTTGLVAGASSFTFDGTGGKPDYRWYDIVVYEVGGRSPMVRGLDYSWNYETGLFTLLISGDTFRPNQWYHIHFQNLTQPLVGVSSSLVNYSFFVRSINIPNIAPTAGNKNLERLNSFISQYEPQCLTRILGYSLYKAFLTESSQRMTNLLNGTDYTDDLDITQRWQGLVHDTDQSLIAYYIYYFFQEANATQTTGVSTSVSDSPEGKSVSPAEKMIKAWNKFSEETFDLINYLWIKKDSSGDRVYPEFTSAQYLKTKDLSAKMNFFGI